jgi:hypothetical protein
VLHELVRHTELRGEEALHGKGPQRLRAGDPVEEGALHPGQGEEEPAPHGTEPLRLPSQAGGLDRHQRPHQLRAARGERGRVRGAQRVPDDVDAAIPRADHVLEEMLQLLLEQLGRVVDVRPVTVSEAEPLRHEQVAVRLLPQPLNEGLNLVRRGHCARPVQDHDRTAGPTTSVIGVVQPPPGDIVELEGQ